MSVNCLSGQNKSFCDFLTISKTSQSQTTVSPSIICLFDSLYSVNNRVRFMNVLSEYSSWGDLFNPSPHTASVSHSTAKCYFPAQGNRSKGKNLHLSEGKANKTESHLQILARVTTLPYR